MNFEVHILVKFLLVVVLSYLAVFLMCELWQMDKIKNWGWNWGRFDVWQYPIKSM